MEYLRKAWAAWKRAGQVINDFLARVVLTVFYLTVFAPFGLGVRLNTEAKAKSAGPPAWLTRQPAEASLPSAQEQA